MAKLNAGNVVGTLLLCLGLASMPVWAETLELGDHAPLWAQIGAAVLLYLHIGGGAVGLATGTTAIVTRKGGRIHRAAGKLFFYAMFVSYFIGAAVAPFLETGQRPNFIAGIMALYLLLTSWEAARGPIRRTPLRSSLSVAVAMIITLAGALFMWQGMNDPSGTVDGSPPQAFYLFMIVGVFAVAGDLHVAFRNKIDHRTRIARHLWRMCTSLFIAAASFFLGQQQALPDFMVGTFWQFGPVLLPLLALVFWMGRTYLLKRARRPATG